jgi:uncharacterized protein (DUF58 family)
MTLLLRLRQRIAQGIRHRVTLLGAMILALLLASGMLAFTTSQNAFFLLFSLLLASILISSFINRLMLAGLSVEAELPPHSMAGREVDVRLYFRNAKSWLPSFALEAKLPSGLALHMPMIPARGASPQSFPYRWLARGKPDPILVDLQTRFPFGFSIRRTRIRVPVLQALYPAVDETSGFAVVLTEVLRLARRDSFAGADEFSHLRQYAPGDAARQIAWSASARLPDFASPLVRVHQAESGNRFRLRLDQAPFLFEDSVRLAAYLVWELQYRNLDFVFLSGAETFPVLSTLDSYTVLKHLALVQPDASAHHPEDASSFLISCRLRHAAPAGPVHAAARRPGEN